MKGEKETGGLNNVFSLTAHTKVLPFRHGTNTENINEVAYTLLLYQV